MSATPNAAGTRRALAGLARRCKSARRGGGGLLHGRFRCRRERSHARHRAGTFSASIPIARSARHILSFAQTLRGGGVERALLRLAEGWIADGRRVTMAIGDAGGPLAAELPAGLELVRIGAPRMGALLAALPGLAARARPDLVFCPGNHYTAAAALIRLRGGHAGPPIVAKVSNALGRRDHRFPLDRAYRLWLALHPRFVDHFVAMTPAMAAETQAMMRVAPARISVIANPPARPIPGAAAAPLPAGRYLLGVGRLAPQKRWDRLIAAMPRIDRDVALVILGEGAERAGLEAQVAALGLGGRVTLPGHAVDPLPAIARAEAVVLVSDFEGVPGVLREALALGTPVVASRSSVAVGEIVTGPALGDIVPPGDAAALVAALDRWLAPGAMRPAPVPPPGGDAAADYLALFDRLVAAR